MRREGCSDTASFDMNPTGFKETLDIKSPPSMLLLMNGIWPPIVASARGRATIVEMPQVP